MSDPDELGEETLGRWIREAGDASVAPEPRYARRLRRMVLARVSPQPHSSRWTRRHTAMGLAGLAALVLIGVILWPVGPELSWAQVVSAVRAKPWIHGTANVPEEGTHEFWLSPARGISASRSGELVYFDDDRAQVSYCFDRQQKTLVREPEIPGRNEQAHSFLRLLDAVFRGDAKLDNPFPGMELVDQRRRHLQWAGRPWVEYQLDLRADSAEDRLTLLIDPQSRLPESMTILSTRRDDSPREKPTEVKFTFDYPEQGPADVYALGVPHDATIDDRVPNGELARLHEGMKNSRERFPRTYLVVVTHAVRSGIQPIPMFIWRKGDKWRREYRLPVARTPEERKALRELKPPPAGPEAAAWWKERTKGWRMDPMEICDGFAVFGDTSKTEKAQWKRVRSGTDLGSYRS
jgi:hypothetical protein